MSNYVTGTAIRSLREKKGYTQKQLADRISVSDKAVSKWETGRGLPDLALLEPLGAALGVSVAELLSGECVTNRNRAGNPLRGRFYVCPVCGNVIHAMGEGSFHCCGVALPPLEAEVPDETHELTAEDVDGEYYVSLAHPMEKGHFISFLALVGPSRLEIVKLYPEQEAAARFSKRGGGILYACCNRHGLFCRKL
ncbi:helix-turn-helix domain-containing protein [Candidatus Pseudoscillospira sp. SGI.172]|uniref:helix-turn-helix domain-containing protein n=1 Tax=Candidatus Pseudoscillospira sp. SGI.172 TaxID=3420582 RepID=UPI002A7EA552|nr:helix-turn-helix domain-containing protein [Pseudoflavonifractor sp.]MDY3018821.1 helix-turn-helix domain-containing protein [Oscillospiraceae bacterium]